MKVNRYIAFLLLICFSAFLGHNLVPHHHHSETFLSPIASDCPIQHEDHHGCDQDAEEGEQHSDEHPTHCHAFNDVVFEKHHTSPIKHLAGHTLIMSVSHTELVQDSQVNYDFFLFNGLKCPLKTIELFGSRGLRGPPATV